MQQLITVFGIALTLACYVFFRQLYLQYRNPLINVVVLSMTVIIAVLLLCGLTFEDYKQGEAIMTYLLGPATVALAVPLYKNRHLVRQYMWAILAGVGLGSIASMATALLIARLGGLPKEVIISLVPKSATIPFAAPIAQLLGGDPALATAFVVATGTFGALLGLPILTWLKIKNPVARGLAMGTVAHGQGTAMALTEGEQQGAMAGMAMGLAGVFTSLIAPILIPILI
ncbi:MAG: LrgB family protein [Sporomusaceae bacterium]|nr:LrgB family protein [Sporomusaceae bacterium]